MRLPLGLLLIPLASCSTLHGASGGESPPPSFIQTTAELRATRLIEVRTGLPRGDAMKLVADALGHRYVVEVADPNAGFTMTAWRAGMSRAGVPNLRYRTRLTARFLGDDWRRLQLRGEANWARGDEWDIGYDAAQLDTASRELSERLGPRP